MASVGQVILAFILGTRSKRDGTLDQVADTLKVHRLRDADAVLAHRPPARQDKVPRIIMRFVRQQTRDAWLQERNALKNCEPKGFIQKNLTRYHRDLLRAAKDWAKEKGYYFVWYWNGKVLARKTSGAAAILIKSKSDLDNL